MWGLTRLPRLLCRQQLVCLLPLLPIGSGEQGLSVYCMPFMPTRAGDLLLLLLLLCARTKLHELALRGRRPPADVGNQALKAVAAAECF